VRNSIAASGSLRVGLVIVRLALAHADRAGAYSGHSNRKAGTYPYRGGPKPLALTRSNVPRVPGSQTEPDLGIRPPVHRLERFTGCIAVVPEDNNGTVQVDHGSFSISLHGIDAPEEH